MFLILPLFRFSYLSVHYFSLRPLQRLSPDPMLYCCQQVANNDPFSTIQLLAVCSRKRYDRLCLPIPRGTRIFT